MIRDLLSELVVATVVAAFVATILVWAQVLGGM